MNKRHMMMLVTVLLTVGVTTFAGQHQWKSPSPRADVLRPFIVQPRAVSGPSNGLYCPDMSEGAVGVHDLGWIPTGMNVEVNVESYSNNSFDPVAAILVATLGTPGGNSIKTTTFYDNDSGGGKDARITFVAPQNGTYVLFVTDNSGANGGCYRYNTYIH